MPASFHANEIEPGKMMTLFAVDIVIFELLLKNNDKLSHHCLVRLFMPRRVTKFMPSGKKGRRSHRKIDTSKFLTIMDFSLLVFDDSPKRLTW